MKSFLQNLANKTEGQKLLLDYIPGFIFGVFFEFCTPVIHFILIVPSGASPAYIFFATFIALCLGHLIGSFVGILHVVAEFTKFNGVRLYAKRITHGVSKANNPCAFQFAIYMVAMAGGWMFAMHSILMPEWTKKEKPVDQERMFNIPRDDDADGSVRLPEEPSQIN